MSPFIIWGGFITLILALLALDLFVFHKNEHEVKFKEAMLLSGFWIGIALIFNMVIYLWEGPVKGMEFLAGYLIEKSLSVDNLFVFIVIFNYFKVEPLHQHRILFWGILGALIMRVLFIFTGVALINRFDWIIYLFGGFLIFTAIKLVTGGDKKYQPSKNPVLRIFKAIMPVTEHKEGAQFFVKHNQKWMATPLFIVLLVIETTDVIFAMDSIPAILAISRDPFIVFTSNVFAILGLRALYFALSGVMQMFEYLKYGLSLILAFVGIKMIISHHVHIPIVTSLGVIAGILAASIIASYLFPPKKA
ncbi:MAG: TerC family protein [Elusimicrobiota bacterium]